MEISRKLKILAHRGASVKAPENTMAAFRLALDHGADGFECDVRLSADGEPMVIHDATVNRTTSGNGCIKNFTTRQLAELDAGSWFDSEYAGESVPSLDELLDWAPEKLTIRIEIKHDSATGIIKIVKAVSSVLANHPGKHQIGISSFNPGVLLASRVIQSTIPTARLFGRNARHFLGRTPFGSRLLGVSGIDIPVLETLGGVHRNQWWHRFRRWRRMGWELTGWTVDDPTWLDPMYLAGFGAVITNTPEKWSSTIKNTCNS